MDADSKNPAQRSLPEPHDTYKIWMEAQRIPIVRGYFIADINAIELAHWDLKGVPAAFVILEGTGGINDAYICEIPPSGKTAAQKHMYEETVFVTKGHGATSVWQRSGRKHTFEWGPGSLFAIPLNAHYQHFNTSGSEAARFYAVTNCCFMMNLFHSTKYIFDNDFVFDDRFDPSTSGYFDGDGEMIGRLMMTTNFVSDTRSIGLKTYDERGRGSTNIKFDLAQQSMGAHISEFPVGTYKKAHRHGPGAHVIILNGQGYSTIWPEGEQPQRFDWQANTVVVPPNQWFHQHFNSGTAPARYLALHWNNRRYKAVLQGDTEEALKSVKDGGWQIDFADEDPRIHATFVAELDKSGAECKMCDYFPACPKI